MLFLRYCNPTSLDVERVCLGGTLLGWEEHGAAYPTEESSRRPASRPRISAAAITYPPRRRTADECDDARRMMAFSRKLTRIKSTPAVVLVSSACRSWLV